MRNCLFYYLMNLPSGFTDYMKSLLGNEAQDLFRALENPPVVSVRQNVRKPGSGFEGASPVAWCDNGFYLSERPVFTLNPLLHAGVFYVQDASSMIYEKVTELILSYFFGSSQDSKPVNVLDLCAAPGGKTTAMINALPDGSFIIANEVMPKRRAILEENLIKWGYPHFKVTGFDASHFAMEGENYDIVAVDAPCSGEGMMRKEPEAINQWSEKLVKECSLLQKSILDNAVKALKPGGFLIYSTCTFNRFENEENADYISKNHRLIPVDLHFPAEWNIRNGIDTLLPVYRFMPHLTKGEGLFLAVFRKPGEWIPSSFRNKDQINQKFKSIKEKKQNNVLKKKNEDFPEIKDILSVDFDKSSYPIASLTKEEALSYLRRESLILNKDIPQGYVVATFEGHPLGLMKNLGTRANNLYPKNWRILMR